MIKKTSLAAAACCALTGNTWAQTSATTETKLLARLEAMEKRLADLEAQNVALKRQKGRSVNETGTRHAVTRQATPSDSYARMATPVPVAHAPIVDRDIWTGLYWGASGGGGVTSSRIATNSVATNSSGSIAMASNAAGSGSGALIDVYAGWNWHAAEKLVLGVQTEATLSNLSFGGTGQTIYTYSVPPTEAGSFVPIVNSDWMVSVLARAGVLVTDKTLLYAIGGWTLADFQARQLEDNSFYQMPQSFRASGWTAGGGVEQKIDAHWSARAEYRYTDFGTASMPGSYQFCCTFTQTYSRQASFHQTMHVGRIGFAYGFNPE